MFGHFIKIEDERKIQAEHPILNQIPRLVLDYIALHVIKSLSKENYIPSFSDRSIKTQFPNEDISIERIHNNQYLENVVIDIYKS